MAAKQRGKKGKSDADASDVSDHDLEVQLDRAEVAVRKARDATAYLQDQWRTHLFRISFLVLLVAFHQCRQPMAECMTNIKLANSLTADDSERTIKGMQAFWLMTLDAFCEICGNVMVFALAAFLSLKPPGTFSSPLYLISTLLLPLQLTSYFTVKEIGCTHVLDGLQEVEEVKLRDFPVTVVFHAIVTGCYFFMESQMAGREQDIAAIMKLRNDLAEAQARGLTSSSNKKKKSK